MRAENKRTALVCDDNQALNEGLQEFLIELNFAVTCTSEAREAVELIQSTPFQLILMDYLMPATNGLELCAVAKASTLNCNSKIYLMTGELDPSIGAAVQELRINRLLIKPFNLNDLENHISIDFADNTDAHL